MNTRANATLATAAVALRGRRIGFIHRLAGNRQLFTFAEDYLEDPRRPTLSLSFKTLSGKTVADERAYRVRVPPFFSNLLPEGRLRQYLADRAGVQPSKELDLLLALGGDLTGATTVTPLDVHVAAEAPRHAACRRTPERPDQPLRFSLAGVQLKLSAIMETDGGLTIPADGMGGSWIVKLPSPQLSALPENEFVSMELARCIDIPVPRLELLPVSGIAGLPDLADGLAGNALAVERFDRSPNGDRVHTEDFAQVFGLFPERKYEQRSYANIAAVLSAEAGAEAVEDFMRRLAFSVLIGNGDMHLKNWSLIYRDEVTPALAPAYDLLTTLPYLPRDQLALTFGGARAIDSITSAQVRRFADKANLVADQLRRIVRETAERTVEAWRGHDAKALLPDAMRAAVGRHLDATAARILRAG